MRHAGPNLIVLLADDLGYGDVAAFGNDCLRTPHLDRLASQGVTLTQHYSGSPMCAPARAALLTGRYNHRTAAVDVVSHRGLDRIALREATLADVFKSAGYATGMVGKWHNGVHDMRYHPNARGFDEFTGFLNGGMDYWQWVLDVNGSPRPSDGRYLTDVFSEEAIAFIKRHQSEPFFLYVAYNAPHEPLQAPPERVRKYRQTGRFTEPVSTIYAMIEQMDAGIGRILETLDSLGLTDHTIVLFSSDNGPDMRFEGQRSRLRYNGRFSGSKGDVLEGGIRVPAIVRWPDGLPGGRRSEELVHFIDWLPTLTGLAGAGGLRGQPLDGRDVLPTLRGERDAANPERFWQWNRYEPVPHSNAAMRDGNWKLYWPTAPGSRTKLSEDSAPYLRGLTEAHWLMEIDRTLPDREVAVCGRPCLFDLESDPYEKTDLSEQHPQRVSRMKGRWDAWWESVMAEWRDARESVVH